MRFFAKFLLPQRNSQIVKVVGIRRVWLVKRLPSLVVAKGQTRASTATSQIHFTCSSPSLSLTNHSTSSVVETNNPCDHSPSPLGMLTSYEAIHLTHPSPIRRWRQIPKNNCSIRSKPFLKLKKKKSQKYTNKKIVSSAASAPLFPWRALLSRTADLDFFLEAPPSAVGRWIGAGNLHPTVGAGGGRLPRDLPWSGRARRRRRRRRRRWRSRALEQPRCRHTRTHRN